MKTDTKHNAANAEGLRYTLTKKTGIPAKITAAVPGTCRHLVELDNAADLDAAVAALTGYGWNVSEINGPTFRAA